MYYLCTEFNKHAKQTIKNLAAKLKKIIQLTKKNEEKMKNNSAMTTHIQKTIGYSSEQLLSYFIENNFDLDSAHDFFNECERKVASLENELQALDLGYYNYEDDSYQNERECADLQHEIESYKELAEASEDAYTLLDNYLADLQVDYAMLMSEC